MTYMKYDLGIHDSKKSKVTISSKFLRFSYVRYILNIFAIGIPVMSRISLTLLNKKS